MRHLATEMTAAMQDAGKAVTSLKAQAQELESVIARLKKEG